MSGVGLEPSGVGLAGAPPPSAGRLADLTTRTISLIKPGLNQSALIILLETSTPSHCRPCRVTGKKKIK